MGRTPWSTRLCVEDCYTLAIEQLARKRLFSVQNGTNFPVTWTNDDGIELFRVGLTLLTTAPGRHALIFCYDLASSYAPRGQRIEYRVAVTMTPCRFGGQRYWFVCPMVRQGIRCGRRVSKLYLPPGGGMFGCRKCHNLTYRSCQTHNRTLDRLLKAPALIPEYLRSRNPRKAILGVTAYTEALRRLSRGEASRPLFHAADPARTALTAPVGKDL